MVTLNSWVYMVCGVLTLFQLQGARLAGEKTAVLLGAVLFVTVGFGLFMRRQWARWVAVGMSLVTWLFGFLALALAVILVFRAYARARNASFGTLLGVLLVLAGVGVILWLNKRLYEHLTSDEGREEFGAPDDETRLTSKSSAAYIAYLVVVAVLTAPGMRRSSLRDLDLAAFRDAMARAEESRRVRKIPDGEARAAGSLPGESGSARSGEISPYQMETPTARMGESAERVNPPQRARNPAADRRAVMDEINQAMDRQTQRRMPDSSSSYQRTPRNANSTADKPEFRVLRCRDSAGTIIFTQNFCPAGARPVE